ncbi:hypothetical protein [Streptomyces acidiscabies]|uniref:hypothetical protein n=1 Tax=Streptomyces acidiscabies TaxID=42234 RepID=UPI0038F7108E
MREFRHEPSLLTFRRNVLHNFAPMFVAAQDDPLLNKYAAQVQGLPLRQVHRRQAMTELSTLLSVQEVALSDVTPSTVLHCTPENRRALNALQPGKKMANRLVGQGTWNAGSPRVPFRRANCAASAPAVDGSTSVQPTAPASALLPG